MKYRRLGATGLVVSEVGFGAWGIGGLSNGASSYGRTDDRTSLAALHRALDLGITFFDTADIYGYGHSETLIGEAMAGRRHAVVIASKGGFLEHNGPQNLTPGYLRQAVEQSLRRLRTDYLDLYQLHSVPIAHVRAEGALDCLRDLVRDGKIRAAGISVKSPEDGIAAVGLGFQSVQVNFNLADQRALDAGLPAACERAGAGVIARTPLCFGFLSGYTAGAAFDARDHRSTRSAAQRALWAETSSLFVDAIGEPGATSAQQALRFCLSYPAVSTAIPGMREPKHVDENVRASDMGPLDAVRVARARQLFAERSFYIGDYVPPVIAQGPPA